MQQLLANNSTVCISICGLNECEFWPTAINAKCERKRLSQKKYEKVLLARIKIMRPKVALTLLIQGVKTKVLTRAPSCKAKL